MTGGGGGGREADPGPRSSGGPVGAALRGAASRGSAKTPAPPARAAAGPPAPSCPRRCPPRLLSPTSTPFSSRLSLPLRRRLRPAAAGSLGPDRRRLLPCAHV